MPRTSRVTLDRQPDTSAPQDAPVTQAGAREERVDSAKSNDKPTLDEIAEEAYAIYLSNGARDGFDMDDWLEAERRIAAKKAARMAQPDVAADRSDDDLR